MKFSTTIGATGVSAAVKIYDTNGDMMDALAFDTAGLEFWVSTPVTAAVQIPLVALASETAAHADGGFIKKANKSGEYRLDLPDSLNVAGNLTYQGELRGATNMAICAFEVQVGAPIQTGSDDRLLLSADPHTAGVTVAAVTNIAAIIKGQADQALVDYDTATGAESAANLAAIEALNDLSSTDVAAALVAYDAPTSGEMVAAFAALNNLSAADVFSHDIGNGMTLAQAMLVLRSRVESSDNGDGTGTIAVYETDKTTVSFIADTTLDSGGMITSVVPRT